MSYRRAAVMRQPAMHELTVREVGNVSACPRGVHLQGTSIQHGGRQRADPSAGPHGVAGGGDRRYAVVYRAGGPVDDDDALGARP